MRRKSTDVRGFWYNGLVQRSCLCTRVGIPTRADISILGLVSGSACILGVGSGYRATRWLELVVEEYPGNAKI
eukprot:212518-Rhodomonas_salina.1